MPLIHRDIPGLYNGVSQQSPPLRLPNQVTEQVNFFSSITSGISRRPGTQHVAHLLGSKIKETTFSTVFKDSEGTHYLVNITGDTSAPQSGVEIYREDGTPCEVEVAQNASYLQAEVARDSFRMCAIADYIVIANRGKLCAMKSTTAPVQAPYALFWVKRGVVSTTYNVWNASYRTKDSTTATDVSTSTIAAELVTQLSSAGHNAVQLGSSGVIRITGTKEQIDVLTASDSYGNTASALLKGTAPRIEALPPMANDGDVIEIVKEDSGMLAGYHMRYSLATHMWVETVAPGSQTTLDESTMPHVLIRTGTNKFRFTNQKVDGSALWETRKAGDDTTAPIPSFIGHTVRDVVYHKNRLGIASGQNIVFSKPNDYFNFFPDTVTTTLDTDPIDRAMGFNEPVILEWAVPFKEDLLLFTDNRQFVMSSGLETFSAEKAMIDPVTHLPCSSVVRPLNLGSSLVFSSDNGKHSLVREYFVQGETLQNDAADITAHCPKYIPDNLIRAVHLVNSGTVLYQSSRNLKQLWAYQYYWAGNEKPQSAWSRLDFPCDILTMLRVDELVYMVIREAGEVRLSVLDVANTPNHCFDESFECTQRTYNQTTGETTLTLPYKTDHELALLWETADGRVYQDFSIVDRDEQSLVVRGDLTTGKIMVGQPMESRCMFSEFFLSPDGKIGALQGRLQLKSLMLSFTTTGNFQLISYYPGRTPQVSNYTGVVLGDAKLATESLRSERRRFMLRGDSKQLEIELVVTGILPASFDSLSFEAFYHVRTQRTP